MSQIHATSLQTTAPAQANPTPRKRGKKPSPTDLARLAHIAGTFTTKTAAHGALQDAGFVCTCATVEELLSAARFAAQQRRTRVQRRVIQRIGHMPAGSLSPHTTTSQQPVRLPLGTPATRLHSLRIRAVKAEAHALLRHGAAGGHTIQVALTNDPSKVGYTVSMSRNFDTYGGAYKGWAATEDHHVVVVPADWRLRVQRNSLADLGGMLTLDAHALLSDGDVRLFAATWARQARGFKVEVEHGFIALLNDEHFHGDSVESALRGIRRKVKASLFPKQRSPTAMQLSVEAFVQRFQGIEATVSVTDAHVSGACDYGIRAWCCAVGIDYDDREVSLESVLQGFRARPQIEVRRAVLYALRRHKYPTGARRAPNLVCDTAS